MTLYEILGEYKLAIAQIEIAESAGNDGAAAAAWMALEQIEDGIGNKADVYAKLVRNFESDAAALREEEKRLAELRRRKEAAVERLKAGILAAMEATGQRKLDTSIGRWTVRTTPRVEITDAGAVPPEYLVPQDPTVSYKDILAAWRRDGELIPGTEIVESESVSLR